MLCTRGFTRNEGNFGFSYFKRNKYIQRRKRAVEGIEHLKRPYTIIFSTMTIDGRIASKTGYSQLSCPRDLMRLHRLRLETGAVMVGAETVIKDDPSLRLKYFKGEDPYKIIID